VIRAYLYDADGVDRERGLDALDVAELGEGHLLWVDVDAGEREEVRAAGTLLGLDEETIAALPDGARAPALFVHQEYFHIAVTEVQNGEGGYKAALVDCVAGRNWVLTSHHEPLASPKSFDDRFRGESNLGRFGSAGFVSALLNEQLLTFTRQLEPIVNEIDHVEQLVLSDRIDEDKLLRRLVSITQRITRLRRLLAPHVEIYEQLAQPNLSQLLPDSSPEGLFPALVNRLDRTLGSLDSARQMVAGSLDLYTTLVAHGTNKAIKLLTVVSITLLPATFLTGLLGMDALPRSLRTVTSFWSSLAVMLLLVTTTLVLARRRGWI
jgi:magnesium transporter